MIQICTHWWIFTIWTNWVTQTLLPAHHLRQIKPSNQESLQPLADKIKPLRTISKMTKIQRIVGRGWAQSLPCPSKSTIRTTWPKPLEHRAFLSTATLRASHRNMLNHICQIHRPVVNTSNLLSKQAVIGVNNWGVRNKMRSTLRKWVRRNSVCFLGSYRQ